MRVSEPSDVVSFANDKRYGLAPPPVVLGTLEEVELPCGERPDDRNAEAAE